MDTTEQTNSEKFSALPLAEQEKILKSVEKQSGNKNLETKPVTKEKFSIEEIKQVAEGIQTNVLTDAPSQTEAGLGLDPKKNLDHVLKVIQEDVSLDFGDAYDLTNKVNSAQEEPVDTAHQA